MPEDPLEHIRQASDEVRNIIREVLKIESENLSQTKPRHIFEEIKAKVEEIVQ